MKDETSFGRSRTTGRNLLFVFLALGVGVAGYLAYNVWNRVQALDSAQQDHAEWVFTQIEIEYLKMDRALVQAHSGSPENLKEFRKRFDIFYSRVQLAERVRNNEEAKPEIERLRRMLDGYLPLIDGSDEELLAGLDDIREGMSRIESLPREIALSSIAIASERSQQERRRIVHLIEIIGVIAFLVTIALVAAVYRLSQQASSLNRTSRLAEERGARLDTTLRASLDAIVVISDTGKITDFNGSAEEIFGIPREEAVGRDYVNLIIPPQSRAMQRKNLERFQRTGETVFADKGRREFEMIDQNGRVFPVEMSVSVSPSTQGNLFIAYIRDITDKRQREAEILQARDEALDAYQEKSRFFAMMSHEMRTPLNGVISALQLLDDNRLDEEQRRYLEAAMASGDILLGHINDVLAIERSEAGSYDQVKQACDISALTAGIIGTMDPLAQSSGTRLHLDQTGLSDMPILTDPRAVQQVLVNLLSNAIKFDPGGDVSLRAWFAWEPGDQGAQSLWLQVEDHGSGIPKYELDRIFEDFVSLDSRYERRTGGTGLGLGIVRRLVERLGGEIFCESVLGEGSLFTVRLPAETVELGERPPLTALAPEEKTEARLHLLVVDDNKINRELTEAMLSRWGHEVTLAEGGQQAIDIAERKAFDVILMDISMPRVNGMQATRAIHSGTGPNIGTPIVALTAHALPQEREEFIAAGMAGFLQKPLDMRALQVALAKHLGNSDRLGSPSAPAEDTPLKEHVRPARPVLNERQISDMLEVLGKEKLDERISSTVDRVESDMSELIAAPGIDELKVRSHALAGVCGMLGAERLHNVLAEIETACKTGDEADARRLLATVPDVWQITRQAWAAHLA